MKNAKSEKISLNVQCICYIKLLPKNATLCKCINPVALINIQDFSKRLFKKNWSLVISKENLWKSQLFK